MKQLKNITVLLLAALFYITSSGFMLYKSHCSCSGEEYTSVIVLPETCKTEFHKHHKHNKENVEISCSAEECHECSDHTKKCGCANPIGFFMKLKDKVTNDDAKAIKVLKPIQVVVSFVLIDIFEADENREEQQFFNTDPPPLFQSSIDFLIHIHQLKIPTLVA